MNRAIHKYLILGFSFVLLIGLSGTFVIFSQYIDSTFDLAKADSAHLSKEGKAASDQSTSEVKQGEAVDWLLGYEGSEDIQNPEIIDSLGDKQTFVPGSLEIPSGWSASFSSDGSTYSDEESENSKYLKFVGSEPTSNTQTLTINKPIEATNISTQTDGYMPMIYKDKAYFLYHHQVTGDGELTAYDAAGDPYTVSINDYKNLNCIDLATNDICEGYPMRFLPNDDTQLKWTSHSPKEEMIIDGKLYYAIHLTETNDVGVGCFDLDTNKDCGFYKLDDLEYTDQDTHGWGRVEGLNKFGDKLYMISADMKFHCFDLSTKSSCGSFQLDETKWIERTTSPYNFISARETHDDKIYFSVVEGINPSSAGGEETLATMLGCFDTTTNTECANWPQIVFAHEDLVEGAPSVRAIFMQKDSNNNANGICVFTGGAFHDPKCFDLNDASEVTPANNIGKTIADADLDGWYIDETEIGNRTYFGSWSPPTGAAYCYDWSTQSECAGFGTNGYKTWPDINGGNTLDLGYREYNGCIYGHGHTGWFWSFDPQTGEYPCHTGQSNIEIDNSEIYCDDSDQMKSWDTVKAQNLPDTVDFAEVSIYDLDTEQLIEKYDLLAAENNEVDISGINNKKIRMEAEIGGDWNTQVDIVTSWINNPAKFCFQSKTNNECDLGVVSNSATLTDPSESITSNELNVINDPEVCTPPPPPPLPRTGGTATIILLTTGAGVLVFGSIGGYWFVKRQKQKSRGF